MANMTIPYWHSGGSDTGRAEKAADEYNMFRRCLPQLIDSDDPITGDLNGRWVIFKDGWVYGLSSYPTEADAILFGSKMFVDEPFATWIVVQVDLEKHKISPLHLLADAISDLDMIDNPAEG